MSCGCQGGFGGGSGSGGGTILVPTSVPTWFAPIPFDYTIFNTLIVNDFDWVAFSLLPKMTIEGVVIKTDTVFVGAGITSLSFSLGVGGDLARFLSPYDAFAAVAHDNFGTGLGLWPESFLFNTDIRLNAHAIGATLNNLTAGTGRLWIKGALLP